MPIPMLIFIILVVTIFLTVYIIHAIKSRRAESYDYLAMTAADLKEMSKKIEEYKNCKRIMHEAVTGEEVLRAIPLKYYENAQKLRDEGRLLVKKRIYK